MHCIRQITIISLRNFSQWKRAVVTRGLQIILPVRRYKKLGEAGIFVGKIVLPLQIDAVHLLPYSLEELCRWTKSDEMHSGSGGWTHRPVRAELKRVLDSIEILPEEKYGALGQTFSVSRDGVLVEAREKLHLRIVAYQPVLFRVLLYPQQNHRCDLCVRLLHQSSRKSQSHIFSCSS